MNTQTNICDFADAGRSRLMAQKRHSVADSHLIVLAYKDDNSFNSPRIHLRRSKSRAEVIDLEEHVMTGLVDDYMHELIEPTLTEDSRRSIINNVKHSRPQLATLAFTKGCYVDTVRELRHVLRESSAAADMGTQIIVSYIAFIRSTNFAKDLTALLCESGANVAREMLQRFPDSFHVAYNAAFYLDSFTNHDREARQAYNRLLDIVSRDVQTVSKSGIIELYDSVSLALNYRGVLSSDYLFNKAKSILDEIYPKLKDYLVKSRMSFAGRESIQAIHDAAMAARQDMAAGKDMHIHNEEDVRRVGRHSASQLLKELDSWNYIKGFIEEDDMPYTTREAEVIADYLYFACPRNPDALSAVSLFYCDENVFKAYDMAMEAKVIRPGHLGANIAILVSANRISDLVAMQDTELAYDEGRQIKTEALKAAKVVYMCANALKAKGPNVEIDALLSLRETYLAYAGKGWRVADDINRYVIDRFMEENFRSPLLAQELRSSVGDCDENIGRRISHVITRECFSYLQFARSIHADEPLPAKVMPIVPELSNFTFPKAKAHHLSPLMINESLVREMIYEVLRE